MARPHGEPRSTRIERDDAAPGHLAGAVSGAVLGAAGAMVFAGFEAAVVARTGLGLPSGALAQHVLALYALTGAVFGGIVGAFRLERPQWALLTVIVVGGWLLSGKLGLVVAESGGGAWVGVLMMLPLAVGIAVVASMVEASDGVLVALAAAGLVLLAVGLPVNLHLLAAPFSRVALVVDGAVLLAAAIGGGAVAALLGTVGRAGIALPLALGGLLAWGLVWPVADRADRDWPIATSDVGPPVVLVVIDTLRADHLGAYGYRRPTSPELDRLARRAVVYADATSVAPWTLPSVATLLTGRYPNQHGAGVNLGAGNARGPVRSDVPTVAEALRARGYATAAVVTNPWLTRTFGLDRGFDRYDDRLGPAPLPVGLHPLTTLGLDPLRWPLFRSAEDVTDAAVAFVAAQERSAWFLVVHYMDVHGPHDVLPEDAAALGAGGVDPYIDTYDASIRRVDRALGVLLAALPRDAWVVVTSDHGEQLVEPRVVGAGVPAGTRHGHTLYQEVLKVPLIVAGPGVSGRRVARPVSTVDVGGALMRLAGSDADTSGEALAEVVGGAASADRLILADSVRYGGEQQVARRGRFKLISWVGSGVQLFDLDADPEEVKPLLLSTADHTERVRKLQAELPLVGRSGYAAQPPVGAEVHRLLQRLGYVD